jgi:hypothetical protein
MQSVKSRVAADFIDLKRPARAAFIVQNANFKCNAVNRQTLKRDGYFRRFLWPKIKITGFGAKKVQVWAQFQALIQRNSK